MITKINIKNFKSLEAIELSLSNLNILTGVNGMGKSTLIQVLLLLRQSIASSNLFTKGINLKGPLTGNLGGFSDVLYKNALDDKIIFSIESDGEKLIWECEKGPFTEILQTLPPSLNKNIPLFSENKFQYISAGRITPHSSFSKFGETLEYKQFGINGEYAIQYLFEKGTEEALIADSKDEQTGKPLPLINQVDFWLKNISPNVSLDIKLKSSNEYELRYKFPNKDKGSNSFSAANSAFGLTFSLPIITALLAAQPGDLLVLENPENDLHPQAQSMLGQLMAKVASAGVQIIVETHSDHIINGICLAVHDKLIRSELTKVYFFNRRNMETSSTVYGVKIKANGRIDDSILIDNGVEGFNDQANKDLKQILFNSSKE
jgi:predicted ATPase